MKTIDRTPKPCHHKHTHQHGTAACYNRDRCRCWPCANARSTAEQELARRHAYGRFNTFTDAEPVRQHVRALLAAGISFKTLATITGTAGSLSRLLYPINGRAPSKQITRVVADKLLAVTTATAADALEPKARTDATGTGRRLRALIRIGWTVEQLATRAGVHRQRLDTLIHNKHPYCLVSTAATIRELYDQLWNIPATGGHHTAWAIRRAKAAGWPPPLAWDDDTIDDPDAQPENAERTPGSDQAAARAELRETVLHLTDRGLTAREIAERTGVTDRTVVRVRSELTRQAS